MFVDEVTIKVKAGNGGRGAVTFFPMRKGPSGGPGGNGGSVFVEADPQMADLHKYVGAKMHKAENGRPGQNFRKNGSDGEDKILKVPVGTLFTDLETGYEIEVNETGRQYLLARGGNGGRGNSSFATPSHQVPREYEPGTPGQEKEYRTVLRLIADFGLVGLPNAGKSSLLNELTAAKVRTAMYAFTTLEPNLGVFETSVIADIPGLIEGASQGKGLGFKFLKHVEKVPVILHCIAADSADIEKDYKTVMHELENYNPAVAAKDQTIILTKTDLVSPDKQKDLMKMLTKFQKEVIPVSIYNPEQFEKLQQYLRNHSSRT
ncbi:GTPase ObgE [Candidatus Roizmanbacteria bacterium]|nr:MAG: GTPase ObgE [Candidatus Roizmanbacteria bacterium]